MTATAYPELVDGRRDGFEQGPWRVEVGSSLRGGASCNLTERVLRVPAGVDGSSRVVRAHELMHIRVSPFLTRHVPVDADVSSRALECAEEYRINLLLGRLGFDTSSLRDGSERPGGRRLAEANQWNEAVCFLMAVAGTGGETEYIRGIRSGQPTWAPALRAIKKRVLEMVEGLGPAQIGDTSLTDEGVPRGFADVTVPIARLLSRSMGAAAPEGAESLRIFRRSLEPSSRRAPSGAFAPLVFDQSMTYVDRRRRALNRRPKPATSGTVMRYPNRLLVDPLQRAFARKTPSPGGVIVIDQSGSMDVTVAELEQLLRCAPDALIVGYSHRPGDNGSTPNAWVLAHRGRVANHARTGNIGNGVDAPVLRWASRQAAALDPVVWVTDGQVTDSHDHPCHSLSLECARLVQRHRIRLVRSLDEVEGALRRRPSAVTTFGRVGRLLSAAR
ncbi:MAG: hypothetical protein HIU57_02960 [Acidobacteria bacterium]|nr:hypothetical protein [Acidobacteriota bacterium]